MSVSHYFVLVGTHFDDLAESNSIKRISTKEDLLQAAILAHQKTVARFDEHQRNRPTYIVRRGKAWEAFEVWQERRKLLYRTYVDLSGLLVAMRNNPDYTFSAFVAWANI